MKIVLGPFELKNNIGLLALTDSSMFIIRLDFWATLKYSASLQIPFAFANTIDKLKNKPIEFLLGRYKATRIDYLDGPQVEIARSKLWKNQIIVRHQGVTTNLGILERFRTDEYEQIFNSEKWRTFQNLNI